MAVKGEWSVEFDSSRLVFGLDAVDRVGRLTADLGCSNVLLVSDPGVRSAGHVERAAESLAGESIAVEVFDRVEENPSTRHVGEGVRIAAQRRVDGIVAVGGGSALDCAKGINFLLTNGGRMQDYRGVNLAKLPMLPSVGIPTTAGTGSDAQSFALISDEATKAKMACGDRKAKFRVVILDPRLSVTAPGNVTATAGMDAISHCVESYVCTRRNPLSSLFAGEGWRLLNGNLERVLADPGDTEARGAMLLGSHLAGAAIEHSMLGAAHSCANPLTARFGITHSLAVNLMLPHVMRYNEPVVGELYAQLSGGTSGELGARILELRGIAGMPTALGELGIPRERLHELAKDASLQWTAEFNPRPVDADAMLEFYEAAY